MFSIIFRTELGIIITLIPRNSKYLLFVHFLIFFFLINKNSIYLNSLTWIQCDILLQVLLMLDPQFMSILQSIPIFPFFIPRRSSTSRFILLAHSRLFFLEAMFCVWRERKKSHLVPVYDECSLPSNPTATIKCSEAFWIYWHWQTMPTEPQLRVPYRSNICGHGSPCAFRSATTSHLFWVRSSASWSGVITVRFQGSHEIGPLDWG